MNIRHIYTVAIFLLISLSLSAQFKVDDKSGKKPDWTSGLQKNYIIGIGNGASMDAARDVAVLDVKSQIVSSVADYISSSSEFNTKEITADKFSELYQSYTNQIKSQSGKRDYLKGISATKIDDFYWEKLYNKKSKEVKYTYFVKYPFSQFDLDELVSDFNEKDQLLTDELNKTLKIIDDYQSIDEIIECQNLLSKLAEIFIDERNTKCLTGIEKCKALLASVYLADAGSELGIVRYSLKIGEKAVRFARKPVVKSNCARITNKNLGEIICEVNYDFDECYDEPENHIKVTYSFSNQKPEKSFYFNINDDKAEITINGNIHFSDGNLAGETVSNATCSIPLQSKFDSPLTITNVKLEWKELGIIADVNLNNVVKNKGQYELRFNIPNDLPIQKISSAANPGATISGYINYKSNKTGKAASIRIYKYDYVTGW